MAGAESRNGAIKTAPGAASSCWRTDLRKVWRPNPLVESDPVCIALRSTRGLAMERRTEVHMAMGHPSRSHTEGLRLPIENSPRAEQKDLVVSNRALAAG
jgi:hypothetical protein